MSAVDVRMATSGGHPGRTNEDFVGAVPGAVVVVDGAGIPGSEHLCHHGTAWYSHQLGSALLARLGTGDDAPLTEVLAGAIAQVADAHRDTCDLADPASPQATVAVARTGAQHLDVLVLADCFVVPVGRDGTVRVLTDPREVAVLTEYGRLLDGLSPGTKAHTEALDRASRAIRAKRNHPGGYWVAKDDPVAAVEAVVTSVPLAGLDGVALLSNGTARLVEAYGTTTWPTLVDDLRVKGPAELIRRLRAVEAARNETDDEPDSDDATAAWWQLGRRLQGS